MQKTRGALPAGLTAILSCVLALSGCVSSNMRLKRQAAENKPKAAVETSTTTAPGVEVTEASLRGSDFTSVPELETIHFDYDSATLSDESLAALKQNAAYLKEHSDLEVRIAGYCDDRGTVEYNLALGQKRAKIVREYYIRLGVRGTSLATISYGKEAPVCSEPTENCWSQNRRAETGIRAHAESGQPTTVAP